MKKKKILFLVGGLGNGGAERVALTLADALNQKKYEVNIFYFREDKNPYFTQCPHELIAKNNFLKTADYLYQSIKKINPDIVIAFEYHTAIKCVFASLFHKRKFKLIASERNDPNKLKKSKLIIWDILRTYAYKKCEWLVCQTEDAKAYFSRNIQKHASVILNPIKKGLPKWEIDNCEKSVITFCRLEKQKNIPLLLDAFEDVLKKYPFYKLYIYGSGSLEEEIKKEIRKRRRQDNIFLESFCDNIHERAIKSRIFVLSSDYEGLSNSMLEAMAMGMPVICTDCPIGGARMVIQDGFNGLLVPVGNRESLSNAILKVIADDELACEMGKNARKINQYLSIENIIEKWEELF